MVKRPCMLMNRKKLILLKFPCYPNKLEIKGNLQHITYAICPKLEKTVRKFLGKHRDAELEKKTCEKVVNLLSKYSVACIWGRGWGEIRRQRKVGERD